jgi:hypothetical protein
MTRNHRNRIRFLVTALLLVSARGYAAPTQYDVLIRNGKVMDGTGSP